MAALKLKKKLHQDRLQKLHKVFNKFILIKRLIINKGFLKLYLHYF